MQVTVNADASPTPSQQVQTGSTVLTPEPDARRATKLVVAVHGVGDQYSYATLQSVVNQFCQYYKRPPGIPLGAFHNGRAIFSIPGGDERSGLDSLAFAEVYWAGIPRQIADEKHTLEEAKKWATTIVERLRQRWHAARKPDVCLDSDFAASTRILHEMIQTIAVTDRICFLAEKAGLFTFDLRKILDDYLGDVQVVAEFADQRELILQRFLQTLSRASAACPDADIYIIAHSEGTVVSLLGMLQALRANPAPEWTARLRGFMTLGSPIDKHLYFWPELFRGDGPAARPAPPIKWRNYYDHGDPIGFELDGIRTWLATDPAGRLWRDVFEFTPADDFGFTRYPFPGKAHVDYWQDKDVFQHFIRTVVDTPHADEATAPPDGGTAPAAAAALPPPRVAAPGDVGWCQRVSRYAPYGGIVAILYVAAFVIYKVVTMINEGASDAALSGSAMFRGTLGLTTLLFGITIAARVPRLTRATMPRLGALLAVVAALGVSLLLWGAPRPDAWWHLPVGPAAVAGMAASLLVVVGVLGNQRPDWGAFPMIGLGTLAVVGCAVLALADNGRQSIWPLFPAAAAFLYLWWLAALLFDLVVIWHFYIRSSAINRRIRDLTTPRERQDLVFAGQHGS